jgi:hypothetical protein
VGDSVSAVVAGMGSLGVSGLGRALRAQFLSDGLEVQGHGFN